MSWERSFGLERVSQAGYLTGLEEVRRRRLLEVKPYLSGGRQQGVRIAGSNAFDAGARFASGLEVAKIGLTPSLTAEFTANPDFGQAEVDEQVVNLSRFSVFFPEKRDFFLESAGIFLFGTPEENQLFFTRRIGLSERGAPIPIDYGAKVTGRIGAYNIGLLQVQTRELNPPSATRHPPSGIPRQHFAVARIKRDILGRSSIGAMFVNRQGGVETKYNRGAGMDAEFNLTDHWRINAFLMGTATPGVRSGFLSGGVNSRYENDSVRLKTRYSYTTETAIVNEAVSASAGTPTATFAFTTGTN
jgi:hypothetical protein